LRERVIERKSMPETAADKTPIQITAYYDGKCPMCSGLANSLRDSSQREAFKFRDMHSERSMPFAKDAVAKEIHVVDQDGQVYRGAQAILKIADQYPRLRPLVAIGQLPVVRPLLPIGYWVVAKNRRFLFGAASRVFWLKTMITIVFCVGLALSSHLWIGPRTYPLAPALGFLPSNDLIDVLLYTALFALAAAILVSAKPQKFIFIFLAIILYFCLLDQTRWQPWVYQYSFLLATLALFSWDSNDVAGRKRALNIARLIVASTYFFSGLQKVNLHFINIDFPSIVEPITEVLPSAAVPLHCFGMLAPFIQIGFAVGLLTRRFRRVSLVLAVSMHVFILAMLGPFGQNWNDIIWPWTAAMAGLDILLFTSDQDFSLRDVFWTNRYPYHACVLILFAILPFLSFFNLWDSYLSSALYAGNLTEAFIYTTDRSKASIPESIRAYFVHTSPDTNVLNFQQWAVEDLNVTPYPETRVYRQIAKSVCASTPYPTDVILLVREQRLFLSKPETGYRCR
jgi:predicted DCC family thiol-disulfide oxidoreductase YuxK